MRKEAKKEYINLPGGAIRVYADGSIDVSGFHGQKANDEAASLITEILLEASPGTEIRSTGDRLNTLPPK